MTDLNRVRENLSEWLKNPAWAEYWRGAPSGRCRDFIALEFYYSEYEDEETAREMDRIEEALETAELRYLAEHAGNNPRKAALLRRIGE